MSTEASPSSQSVNHAEAGANGPNDTRESRERVRSASFPASSLALAPQVLRDAGKYGFEHSDSTFASYLGLSTTNSGTFRERVAAFRDFGLVTGRGGTLTMTDIARQIARPLSDEDERHALQDAFLHCEIFARLYDESAKGVPLKQQHLEARAIRDLQIAAKNGKRFMKSFVGSLVVAGLGEASGGETVTLREKGDLGLGAANEPLVPDGATGAARRGIRTPNSGPSTTPTPGSHFDRSSLAAPHTEPAIHQVWEIQDGQVLFEVRMEGALPSEAYSSIGTVIACVEKLVGSLGPVQPVAQVEELESRGDGLEE